jgi:hypothetical protein
MGVLIFGDTHRKEAAAFWLCFQNVLLVRGVHGAHDVCIVQDVYIVHKA